MTHLTEFAIPSEIRPLAAKKQHRVRFRNKSPDMGFARTPSGGATLKQSDSLWVRACGPMNRSNSADNMRTKADGAQQLPDPAQMKREANDNGSEWV